MADAGPAEKAKAAPDRSSAPPDPPATESSGAAPAPPAASSTSDVPQEGSEVVSLSWTGGRGCKVALRYIPAGVTEAQLVEVLSSWTPVRPVTLLYFVPGKESRKRGRVTGQAYLLFAEDAVAERFANSWNASNPFATPQTGVDRVPSVAVPAPSQRLFRRRKTKKDRIEDSIEKDPEYLKFLARLAPEGRAVARAEEVAAADAASQQEKAQLAALPAVVEFLAKSKPGKDSDGKGSRGRNSDAKGKRQRGRKDRDLDKADAKAGAKAVSKAKAQRNKRTKKKAEDQASETKGSAPRFGAKAQASPPARPKARSNAKPTPANAEARSDSGASSTAPRSSRNSRKHGKDREGAKTNGQGPRSGGGDGGGSAEQKKKNRRRGSNKADAGAAGRPQIRGAKPDSNAGATPNPGVGAVRIMRRTEDGANARPGPTPQQAAAAPPKQRRHSNRGRHRGAKTGNASPRPAPST